MEGSHGEVFPALGKTKMPMPSLPSRLGLLLAPS